MGIDLSRIIRFGLSLNFIMKFVENLHKLILATITFIFAKNILQIIFGIISNSPNKQYDSLILINP